jgi:methionyl-tRNA formyltransferase
VVLIISSLRGPAPIHHALLLKRPCTGVTLQTLHPNKFDHGNILAQTPFPGLKITPQSTPNQLIEKLGLEGAELLGEAVEQRIFVPPLDLLELSRTQINELTNGNGISHAPKITPEDRRIDWEHMTSAEILHRSHVLGGLWDTTVYQDLARRESPSLAEDNAPAKRIKYHEILSHNDINIPASFDKQAIDSLKAGTPFAVHDGKPGKRSRVGVTTVDGFVIIQGCTLAGGKKDEGEAELLRLLESTHHY